MNAGVRVGLCRHAAGASVDGTMRLCSTFSSQWELSKEIGTSHLFRSFRSLKQLGGFQCIGTEVHLLQNGRRLGHPAACTGAKVCNVTHYYFHFNCYHRIQTYFIQENNPLFFSLARLPLIFEMGSLAIFLSSQLSSLFFWACNQVLWQGKIQCLFCNSVNGSWSSFGSHLAVGNVAHAPVT